jgi:biotin-(acetyl-CoA carboxylase) ligase
MDLPPLFTPLASAGADPVAVAVHEARAGCDGGLVVYDIGPEQLRVAVVFAPEVALAQAAVMLPLCGIGVQNALGVLAPPEIAVQLGWDGGIWLNGARCGRLSLHASGTDPEAVPDWLVVGMTLELWAPVAETGLSPDTTTLDAEGCGDIAPDTLIPAWLRHTLVWLNTWEVEGTAPLLREWTGLAHGIGAEVGVAGQAGQALGVDEEFALVLKQAGGSVMLPLSALLKDVT